MLLLFSITATEVNACSCRGPRPPCEAYWEASAVFIGTVTSNSTIPLKIEGHQYQQRSVTFAIETAFRGVEGSSTEVITGIGGGDCGFSFQGGSRYLVYAYTNPEDKKLHTSICSRTRALSRAREDLDYIRGLASAAPGGLIFGEVQRYREGLDPGPRQTPMAGLKIRIVGTEKQVEVTTGPDGRFSVAGLPPGDYTLKLSVPPGRTSSHAEQKVKVADRGCAQVHFGVVSDGRLSGKVLNAAGQPVPKTEVSLCNPDERRYRYCRDTAYSDQEGRYELKAVSPGRYVLGIRFDGLTSQDRPFPLLYYPGVESIDQATIVTIGDGETIEKYDLVLPRSPVERTVSGIVLWSDGKPVPNARIEYSQVDVPIAYGTNPDQEGRFSFKVYDGMKITIRATVEVTNGNYIYSDYVHAIAIGEDVKVRIIVPVNRR
jgi:hypothetical protein